MGKKKKVSPVLEEHLHLPPHPSLSGGKGELSAVVERCVLSDYHTSFPSNERSRDEVPAPIIDTHSHLVSTFDLYKNKYPDGLNNYHEFARGFYRSQQTPNQ